MTNIFNYDCLKVQQRKDPACPSFLMFSAKVGEVLQWAEIERHTHESQDGPQRINKPYKTRAVKSYFEVNESNSIPTSIILGFKPGSVEVSDHPDCDKLSSLSFRLNEVSIDSGENSESAEMSEFQKVATVVDGQHRLLGMAEFDPELYVNVVGIFNADDAEIAFQFLVINNKASRVSSDHIRSLSLHYDKEALNDRLNKVRLNLDANLRFVGFANELEESPFKGILKLSSNRDDSKLVAPAAIEESVNYIRSQSLPELTNDDDMIVGVFFAIWGHIQKTWPDLWCKGSHLFKKVSVICLTQYVVNLLLSRYDWGDLDLFEPSSVDAEIKRIVAGLDQNFWNSDVTEWTAKGLDTQAGRKMLLDALDQMVRNIRRGEAWSNDIGMISLK
jgi:DGQHR domain-containing protein